MEPAEETAAVVRYLDNWETITSCWYVISMLSIDALLLAICRFQIADYLLQLDRLHHTEKFTEKERAAIVASRVYYFLNEYSEALKYALRATGALTSSFLSLPNALRFCRSLYTAASRMR